VIATSRLIAALAYAGAAFFFGLVLGERGELGVVQYAFLIGVPVAAIVLAAFAKRARFEVLFTGTAMVIGLVAGQRSFERAFHECSDAMPKVNAAIRRHTEKHGEYPADLTKLGIEIPCECILRDTILHYSMNERSYRLWYTNDVVMITATEKTLR
jgi:hypothetical protein